MWEKKNEKLDLTLRWKSEFDLRLTGKKFNDYSKVCQVSLSKVVSSLCFFHSVCKQEFVVEIS